MRSQVRILSLILLVGFAHQADAEDLPGALATAARGKAPVVATIRAPRATLQEASRCFEAVKADLVAMFPAFAPVVFRSANSSRIDLDQPIVLVLLDPRRYSVPIAYAASVTDPEAFISGLGTAKASNDGIDELEAPDGKTHFYAITREQQVLVSVDRELIQSALTTQAPSAERPGADIAISMELTPLLRAFKEPFSKFLVKSAAQAYPSSDFPDLPQRLNAIADGVLEVAERFASQIRRLDVTVTLAGGQMDLSTRVLPVAGSDLARWLGAAGAGSVDVTDNADASRVFAANLRAPFTTEMADALATVAATIPIGQSDGGFGVALRGAAARETGRRAIEDVGRQFGPEYSVSVLAPIPETPGVRCILYVEYPPYATKMQSISRTELTEVIEQFSARDEEDASPVDWKLELLDSAELPFGLVKFIGTLDASADKNIQELVKYFYNGRFEGHVGPAKRGFLLALGPDSERAFLEERTRLMDTSAEPRRTAGGSTREPSGTRIASGQFQVGPTLRFLVSLNPEKKLVDAALADDSWSKDAGSVEVAAFVEGLEVRAEAHVPMTKLFNAMNTMGRALVVAGVAPTADEATVHYTRALAAKNPDDALAEVNQALEIQPKNAQYLEFRGLKHFDKHDSDAALRDLSLAIELDPNTPSRSLSRGRVYAELGQYEKALNDLNAALRLSPRNADVFQHRSFVYIQLHRLEDALADATSAIENDPNDPSRHAARAAVYGMLRQLDLALDGFNRAIELDPKDAMSYAFRSGVLSRLGKDKQAREDLDTAIAIEPNAPFIYAARGDIALDHEDWKRAAEDFAKASELDPNESAYFNNRAWALSKIDRLDEALSDVNRALSIHQEAGTLDTRAMIYLEQGNLEHAVEDFDKAIEIGGVGAGTYYNRGRARFLLGRGLDADADYQKAIELDSKYTDKPYSRDRPRPSDDQPKASPGGEDTSGPPAADSSAETSRSPNPH